MDLHHFDCGSGCGSGFNLSPWCGSGFELTLWCGSGFALSPWCGSGLWLITLMRIRIPHITLMTIRIRFITLITPDNFQIRTRTLEKMLKYIGSYSIHSGLSSANWCGSGSESSWSLWCGSGCGSGFLFDADADPSYKNDADPSGSTTLGPTVLYVH